MAILDTKQKILDSSLHLFNVYGISNVRLQQIADETGISVGNLAYHFNNKEAITESLIFNIILSLEDLISHYGKYDSLKDLNYFFLQFYDLCTLYKFFNFDILEIKRNFPSSYELLKPLFNKAKLQLEGRINLYRQQRLLRNEADVKNIALNIWLLMFFMPTENQVNNRNPIHKKLYCKRLWSYLRLYFTSKGRDGYNLLIKPEITD